MYLPYLLNSRGFFQRTATWMDAEGMAEDILILLSRATSAVVSILRIEQAQYRCVKEFELFEDQLSGVEGKIVFNSQSMVELQNEISPLLSSLRIMQDEAWKLIRRELKFKNSLPRSISDVMRKIDKHNLPGEIVSLLSNYWNSGGSQIREYRILDQHYAGLADHIFLQLKPAKKVLLYFPDDPTKKSRRSFTYNKETCGISLLRIGFDDLHELIENFAEYFGYAPSQLQPQMLMGQLGDLRPFRNRLLGLLVDAPIITRPDGSQLMNISGLRMSQKENGSLEVQKLLLDEEQLDLFNRRNIK